MPDDAHERHVKIFRNGRNQAVRTPREFELSGEDAVMRKEGGRLIIKAAPPKSLMAVLAKSAWEIGYLAEKFPKVTFLRTRERG